MGFFNKITRFVIVDFYDVPGAWDYPKNLPLPNRGDRFLMSDPNGMRTASGIVKQIHHNLSDSVHEIRIEVSQE